ncbi:MAG: hypothetical protein CMI58_03700 [Parcubacteria group bacterium]|nr:hypothetical protein [Parcubacteria group bacterium]|tara:strand:+ start:221 stop:1327 length:1107 start_codon:yes stop_codon:yes gene_type:complete
MEYVNINYVKAGSHKPDSWKLKTAKDKIYADKNAYLTNYQELYILVDFDFNVIGNIENYWAAKETNQKAIPCLRPGPKAESSNFPQRVQLEITSVCNIECIMCPRSEQFNRPRMHMEWDIFKKSINEIAQHGILQLQLFHIGESLLNPLFFDMMEYISQFDNLGAKWLSSNGNVLNEMIIKKLLKSPIDFLNISLNSTVEDIYNEICFESDYSQVVANLNMLIRLKKESGRRKPVIRTQLIDQPLTRNQLSEYLEIWGDKADLISINKLEAFAGQVSKNISFSTGRIQREKKSKVCKRLDRGDFFILSNGEVTICDADFNGLMSLGNIKNTSLKEIWDGDGYQEVLKTHREKNYEKYELCRTCTDWDL